MRRLKRIVNNIADYGDFQEIYDMDVIVDAICNVLGIVKGSYPHDPTLGSEIMKFVFDPLDFATQESIKEEIKTTLGTFVPMITVNEVIVTRGGEKAYVADVFITYHGESRQITLLVNEFLVQLVKES